MRLDSNNQERSRITSVQSAVSIEVLEDMYNGQNRVASATIKSKNVEPVVSAQKHMSSD